MQSRGVARMPVADDEYAVVHATALLCQSRPVILARLQPNSPGHYFPGDKICLSDVSWQLCSLPLSISLSLSLSPSLSLSLVLPCESLVIRLLDKAWAPCSGTPEMGTGGDMGTGGEQQRLFKVRQGFGPLGSLRW